MPRKRSKINNKYFTDIKDLAGGKDSLRLKKIIEAKSKYEYFKVLRLDHYKKWKHYKQQEDKALATLLNTVPKVLQ